MKYCKNCNVNVHKELDNCPICGSYVDQNTQQTVYEHYPEMEDAVGYPKIKEKIDEKKAGRKISLFAVLVSLLSVAINLYDTTYLWCAWVGLGGVWIVFCIVPHIFYKKKIYVQLPTYAIATSLSLLLIDGFDGHGFNHVIGWSLEYVIPFVLLGCLIALDFLIIFKGKKEKTHLMAMYFTCVISLIPQIVIWLTPIEWATWASFTLFLTAIANALAVTIVLYETVKAEFGKKFNL